MIEIPYAKQWIDDDDVAAVNEVLRGEWLTTGPMVDEFESELAKVAGTSHAVAVSSGTAALHAAMFALNVSPGDEVIVPAMTFAATANCVVYQGGSPVFADVDPDTLLISPTDVAAKLSPRTKAIIAVDYAGQPCLYDELNSLANRTKTALVADACHSLGGKYREQPVGSLAQLNAFSFHPVKQIATGEGGAVTTDDEALAERMRRFRNHGIGSDHRQRAETGSWFYEMNDLGYNYRITDIQCALGRSQLKKLEDWIDRRREIAAVYEEAIADIPRVSTLEYNRDASHAFHLFVVQLDRHVSRGEVFSQMREAGIGVNVHYVPVHLHPYYRRRFYTEPGMCPNAEQAYERILSLPMYPKMTDADVQKVIAVMGETMSKVKDQTEAA